MTAVEVSIRVRPFNGREVKYDSRLIVAMESATQMSLKMVRQGKIVDEAPRKFTFDHCFWTFDKEAPAALNTAYADQKYVYESIGRRILDNALEGFNSCLFAYGQTGSGKTYSMMGVPSDPGVIPRLCADLFARAQAMSASHTITVECSYLEIYNELVRDLLNPAGLNNALRVRQHPKLGVYVEGLTKLQVTSEAEIGNFLEEGGKVRAVAATNMNSASSRSHAILTLSVRTRCPEEELDVISQLNLVDLAGSERAGATGATGDTLTEGSNINKSLTTLGMCLSRLAEAANGVKAHIPFRDSQLTFLLNDSLGGNSKTAMLANISPADINCEETLSTLRFAATTKKIKNHAIINEDPQQRLIRELRQEIEEIKAQIKVLAERAVGTVTSPGASPAPTAAPQDSNDSGTRSSSQPSVCDGATTAAAAPGADTPQESQATLMSRLQDNARLMEQVTESDADKTERNRKLKASRAKAMAALQTMGVTVDASLPRLITLNEDLHSIPSVALLYYLQEGDNVIGASKKGLVRLPPACSRDAIADVHATVHVDGLRRSVVISIADVPAAVGSEGDCVAENADAALRPATPTGAAAPPSQTLSPVFVNGVPVAPGTSRELLHLDRIVLGHVAFRHAQPAAWYSQGAADGFSNDAHTAAHTEALEQHFRLGLEADQLAALRDLVAAAAAAGSGAQGASELAPGASATLADAARAARYSVAESETTLAAAYPATTGDASSQATGSGAKLTSVADDDAQRYDFRFAMSERDQHYRLQEQRRRDEQRARELLSLQSERDGKRAEIAVLQEELRMQQQSSSAAAAAAEKEAAEAAAAQAAAAEAEAAAAAAAAEAEAAEAEAAAAAAEEAAAAAAAAAAALPAASNAAEATDPTENGRSVTPSGDESRRTSGQRNVEEGTTSAPQNAEGASSCSPVASNAQTAAAAGKWGNAAAAAAAAAAAGAAAKEKLLLARELQEHEEACRIATMWKPGGPPEESPDSAEYRFAMGDPSLDAVKALPTGTIQLQLPAEKLRLKRGLFSRSGFHHVHLVVRPRFLYYFDVASATAGEPPGKTVAAGSLCVWGCGVSRLKKGDKAADGREFVLRLLPSTPRKPNVDNKGASDENNVVLAFPDEATLTRFTQLVVLLSLPEAPPRVAEYIRAQTAKR